MYLIIFLPASLRNLKTSKMRYTTQTKHKLSKRFRPGDESKIRSQAGKMQLYCFNFKLYYSTLILYVELRAELDRMEKVIDAMITPQIEKYQQQQKEIKEDARKSKNTRVRPKLPQIKATVSLKYYYLSTYKGRIKITRLIRI